MSLDTTNNPLGTHLVDCFAAIAPYINNIATADMGISVIKGDTYQVYIPSQKMDLKIKPGDKIVPGSAADRCMKEKKRIVVASNKANSRFGIPCIANAWPILDEYGNSVGCVVTSETTEIQEFIKEASENLGSSSEELTAAIQNLNLHAEQLANRGKELNTISQSTVDKVKNTDDILKFIHSVASQTNLLGLNAAIEAARVGEMGRGFGVVADEVRKLATHSSASAKQITDVLKSIQEAITSMAVQSSDVTTFVDQQVAVIEEIASASQELAAMAQELQALAHKMNSVE